MKKFRGKAQENVRTTKLWSSGASKGSPQFPNLKPKKLIEDGQKRGVAKGKKPMKNIARSVRKLMGRKGTERKRNVKNILCLLAKKKEKLLYKQVNNVTKESKK